MNKRLLNFTEYLKEELKIDLSDKKFKANLEALLVVADQAIWDYCNGLKKRRYGNVINELMEIEGYSDSILYGVAATLLSTLDKSEIKNIKEGGEIPKIKIDALISQGNKEVLLDEDTMYKTDVELKEAGEIIEDDKFKVVNVPGQPGEIKASELLIKISEKNIEELAKSVEEKNFQTSQIGAIKKVKGKFSLVSANVGTPLKAAILIPPINGTGIIAELASKTPFIEVSGTSAKPIEWRKKAEIKEESNFKTQSADLEEGFAEKVFKRIEEELKKAKEEATEKMGPDVEFEIKISDMEVISSASNVWNRETLDPTDEMDFDTDARSGKNERNDQLAKDRAESFEDAISDMLLRKKLTDSGIEISKKWKVTDTGGKTDDDPDRDPSKPIGQYVEVRLTLSAVVEDVAPGDLSAYLKYNVLNLTANFYTGSGGENFLSMDGWDFERPKYIRHGIFKNVNFGPSLDFRGLPWWLRSHTGKGGRDFRPLK